MYGFHVAFSMVTPKANFHTVDNKVFPFPPIVTSAGLLLAAPSVLITVTCITYLNGPHSVRGDTFTDSFSFSNALTTTNSFWYHIHWCHISSPIQQSERHFKKIIHVKSPLRPEQPATKYSIQNITSFVSEVFMLAF